MIQVMLRTMPLLRHMTLAIRTGCHVHHCGPGCSEHHSTCVLCGGVLQYVANPYLQHPLEDVVFVLAMPFSPASLKLSPA